MSAPLHLNLHFGDLLGLFGHFLMLSLLSVGGAVSTIPEMHRYLVERQHWLTDPQFNASIAIAQAAPGPNVLFVALMGWNVGLNAGDALHGLMLVALTMSAVLLPSSTLAFLATRWLHRNRQLRAVRAFKQGMAPIVVALLLATAWILSSVHANPATDLPIWLATLAAALIVWRTRIHLLWLLGIGAVLGWYHLI
jgi:chromate transporter